MNEVVLNNPTVINYEKKSGGKGIIAWIAGLFKMSINSYDFFRVHSQESENERVLRAQKLLDYYRGDIQQIARHVGTALSATFTEQDIKEFQGLYLPILRRIIDKLCIVYKADVNRTLTSEDATQKYKEILADSNIVSASKLWHRMGVLCDTVLVQPVVREREGEKVLFFDVWTPNKFSVTENPNDFLKADTVSYSIQVRLPDGSAIVELVNWSDTQHFKSDLLGNKIMNPENPKDENPYGVLPFEVLRFKDTDNFYGSGQELLVNIEEKIDILLIQLMHLLVMQGFGQPVVINGGLEGVVKTGPKHPLILNNSPSNPSATPDFKFVSASGKVAEITGAIDWLISRTMTTYGLSQTSSMEQSQVASGYAKKLDNWDVIEKRAEDIGILKEFERRLFEKVKVVLKEEGMADFADNEELSVEFGDYEFPEDPLTEIKTKEERLKVGLWTPVMDLMAEDDALTEDEAVKTIQKNLEIRNMLDDEFGILSLLGGAAKGTTANGQAQEPDPKKAIKDKSINGSTGDATQQESIGVQ